MQTFGQVIPVTGPNVGFPGNVSRLGSDPIIAARPVLSTTATYLAFGAGAVLIPSATGGSWQSLADFLATATNAQYLQAQFAGVAVRNVKTMLSYSALQQAGSPPTVVSTTATQATVGSTTIVVASATGIAIGQSVEGSGIQANTLVSGISGTTITISLPTIAALSTTAVAFTSSNSFAVGYYSPGLEGEVLERGSIAVVVSAGTPQAGNAVFIRTVANSSLAGTSVGDFEAAADNIASPPTVGTTVGSTSVTATNTSLAVGQQVTGYMFPPNTYVATLVSTTGITTSQPALVTIASGGVAAFSNTGLLGLTAADPWLVFRTGQIDANNVAEITVKSRHAA